MSHTKEKTTLIVFLKFPEPGNVKTRLAKEVGEEQAATIYANMAKTIVKNVVDPENYKTAIYYDPPEKREEIQQWIGNQILLYSAQKGNFLGDKISNAFEEIFNNGSEYAVIIGSDCVDVSSNTIKGAIALLYDNDVVLGPAADGGYYLLGLNKHRPEIFQEIDWSTEQVLNQTIEKILENNLSYRLLKTLRDIDNLNDLKDKY